MDPSNQVNMTAVDNQDSIAMPQGTDSIQMQTNIAN